MESDPHIICSLHPHVQRSNLSATLQPQPWFEDFTEQPRPLFEDFSVDAPMDKYKKRQQHQYGSEFRSRRPADEGRRTKMRMDKERTDNKTYDSRGKSSNSTSPSLHKQPQPNGGGGGSRGRSPRPGFDPQTSDNLYKISAKDASLPPRPSVNLTKVVNWRLACFMCNEYLTRGTLLGRPWPPQDLNPKCGHENNDKSEARSSSVDHNGDQSKREKERLYHTLADFLQAGDVNLPGIVNPSELATWLGLK